ncbi:MAG: hypothetical protein ACI84E_002101, partial [Planctomycetota bacterium]
ARTQPTALGSSGLTRPVGVHGRHCFRCIPTGAHSSSTTTPDAPTREPPAPPAKTHSATRHPQTSAHHPKAESTRPAPRSSLRREPASRSNQPLHQHRAPRRRAALGQRAVATKRRRLQGRAVDRASIKNTDPPSIGQHSLGRFEHSAIRIYQEEAHFEVVLMGRWLRTPDLLSSPSRPSFFAKSSDGKPQSLPSPCGKINPT